MLHVNLLIRELRVAIVALSLANPQKWAMEPWDTGTRATNLGVRGTVSVASPLEESCFTF